MLALLLLLSIAQDDAAWQGLIARANHEKKPVVVFFRPGSCGRRCDDFERVALQHPTIQRRLPAVIFATLPGEAAGVALFDRSGVQRVRWPVVPDATNLGIILDSVVAVAPHFERAVELTEAGDPAAGEVAAAVGLARIGRLTDARAALARALERGSPEVRSAANEALVALDAREKAAEQPVRVGAAGTIRILPLSRQVVSGRQIVRTHVASAAVARVAFALDGRDAGVVARPPFAAALDFGKVPERHAVRVVAYDREGKELGRDERVFNEAGETFRLRITAPASELASGPVRVSMNVRTPAARRVQRVVVSWNDAERAVLTKAPWETTLTIPDAQMGVVRAVAELDDGRTSEDAVLLNAGMVEEMDVQLVELPITVVSRTGAPPKLTPERITVREGKKARRVESVAAASETPLTVGLLIDISGSMHKPLADVQEAAIGFLQTILTARDRAFFVAFDDRARLLQPATSDVTRLRRRIMSVRPEGRTALHDAMVLGLLQFEGIKGGRAMVLFSDGLDMTSQYGAGDVSELARRVNVPIHVIAADPEDRTLEPIALSTGGTFHTLTELAALPGIYARIEAALRAQVLAFVRTEPGKKENEWRNIRVTVEGEGLDVYAPEGYYVPW
ncbi:MAG TPA: VWA domain-containing protein [Thermoanaerobaculia bacterium]|jgi:VWFA-related protein